MSRQSRIIYGLLIIAVLTNIGLWFSVRQEKARWMNVPPVPSETGILAFTLGDRQFAYRFVNLTLQNLGDSGGRSTPLKEYNYTELTKWMYLADKLDPVSDFTPFMASFYFGAVTPPEIMRPMIPYLAQAGQSPLGQKWRWLAQAVYLSRYKLEDLDLALKLAYKLADNKNPSIRSWALQMPGYVLTARGDKEAAYAIMLQTLKSSADKIAPEEVYSTRIYICSRILDAKEAAANPLCEGLEY